MEPGSPDGELRQLVGTWRLADKTEILVGIRRFWIFDLRLSGSRLTGETRSGRETSSGGQILEFGGGRPVELDVNGSSILLRFNMDGDSELEELIGGLAGDVMSGGSWTAERLMVPDGPSNLQATALSGTEVELTWVDNSSNETGFPVAVRCCGGGFQEIGSFAPNTESGTVISLQPSITYDVRLAAVLEDRWQSTGWRVLSDARPQASFTTLAR